MRGERQIDFSIRGLPSSGYKAIFHHGRIVFSEKEIEHECKALVLQEVEYEDIPKIIAVHFTPILVHELRHAINERHIQGAGYVLEDELSAFSAQSAAFDELKKVSKEQLNYKTATLDEIERLHEAWLSAGPAGINRIITLPYTLAGWVSINPQHSQTNSGIPAGSGLSGLSGAAKMLSPVPVPIVAISAEMLK